eukprot:CAMPEP_0197033688 /NCGR_PEP_ID=MMETSP1384-20130603/12030_1 /TAXON_ID=29189 /ORGANISM="Ammonia sp." /LENGTH=741 /DNA_ID=CAMNT_0042463531 /DNA_START=222 /DNA_END=2447 /DNA_ORIENTATION=+
MTTTTLNAAPRVSSLSRSTSRFDGTHTQQPPPQCTPHASQTPQSHSHKTVHMNVNVSLSKTAHTLPASDNLLDENHSQHTPHSEHEDSSRLIKPPSLHDSNSEHVPKHSNKSERSQPLHLTLHHTEEISNNLNSNAATKAAKKTPTLSLRQSLSKIKDLKHVFHHSAGDAGDFVMLDTPTASSRESSCEPPPKPVLNALDGASNAVNTRFIAGAGNVKHVKHDEWEQHEEYKHEDAPHPMHPVPVLAGGVHRPALSDYRSHTSLKHRSIAQHNSHRHNNHNDGNYFDWRADAGDTTNYFVPPPVSRPLTMSTLNMVSNRSLRIGQMNDVDQEEAASMRYHQEDDSRDMVELSEESYPSAIKHLTSKHTRSLFMLETTKRYLLTGYLRQCGIEIKIAGIREMVTAYFDDSLIMYEIKIADLFAQINNTAGADTLKLFGKTFTFDLNLDHEIELVPTLKIQQTRDSNGELVNDIELALECENLPSKIDKCGVLINMLCICHEIKYQKIDIYSFGLDYYNKAGDYHNFNLLNKRGLQMIIPQTDIENLHELQFKINATVLDIEYDPHYENFGVIPSYNERLTMSERVRYVWKLNQRILKIMNQDIFKQKFYSPHFDQEHWCLSCYQLDGHIMVCLNLLRLPSPLQSIECDAVIAIQKEQQVLCRLDQHISMDIGFNSCFKWTLDADATHTLFNAAMCTERVVSINIDLEVTDAVKMRKQCSKPVMAESAYDDDEDDGEFEFVEE